MQYKNNIKLSVLPLAKRNKIVNLIKSYNVYYNLNAQIISSDAKTIQRVLKEVQCPANAINVKVNRESNYKKYLKQMGYPI